ncbi:MAG: DUF1080 domain-containing protein [Acidobacteria bacterium]|nr:DUF1080 domain-containing protein [Acidobacteriota bacterium]
MTRRLSAALVGAVVLWLTGLAGAQTQAEVVELFNARNLDGWVVENSTSNNFTVTGGVLRVEGPEGWLRSEQQYGDFSLLLEVRFLTSDADSGVFLRAPGPASNVFIRGWPANAYQVQVRDMSVNRTNNPFWAGNLYRHRVAPGQTTFAADAALKAVKPTGEWQLFEIEASGDRIQARINGQAVLDAGGIVNPRGFIGIQGETGALEYRRIAIRERTTASAIRASTPAG